MNRFYKKVVSPIITTIFLLTTIFSGAFSVYADEETTYFYLHDHLGSVDTVLDNEGNVVERRDYMPFGEERLQIIKDTDHPELYESESYGYTDKELDDETGLMYYGARYYDPVIGRFLAVDPLVLDEAEKSDKDLKDILQNPQALNAYSYVLNNPLIHIDPTGELFLYIGPKVSSQPALTFEPVNISVSVNDKLLARGLVEIGIGIRSLRKGTTKATVAGGNVQGAIIGASDFIVGAVTATLGITDVARAVFMDNTETPKATKKTMIGGALKKSEEWLREKFVPEIDVEENTETEIGNIQNNSTPQENPDNNENEKGVESKRYES
ncbi:RHS repeat-associated core domain-containing protein [Patescibacteria group bacterium]|nr:RHS repeat-associated core domain-containing protein [Patescibacteria group bacterium]